MGEAERAPQQAALLVAIMSTARSRSISSQSVAYGARYSAFVWRVGELTSDSDEEPRGHSRPREIGESGSPSMWTTRSSLTYTF
jgi:hypothetical protein